MMEILREEGAKLRLWIDVAVEYYKKGQVDVFTKILDKSGQQANLEYPEYDKDQVRALDTLAAHYVKMGHRVRDSKDRRKELYTKATLLYTTADKIRMYDLQHLLGRAYFCMLEGNKMDQADQQFTFVLQGSQETGNIPALLGKACIAFQKKDYTQALFFYKKALRLKPDCPANVRVGLGHCYAKLNRMDMARMAFQRALQLDECNVAAIAALAILNQNLLTAEGVTSAIRGLSLAYKLEPENPLVLNQLANHFFYKGELGKVEQLAMHAFAFADTDCVKAESCFQLARAFHRNFHYEKAFRYYYQAAQLASPGFILPQYGLGQMYIQRKEYPLAIACFEKILAVHPNNAETLKILGSLYAHPDPKEDPKKAGDNRAKARVHLTKLIELTPDDVEVLIDLAQLLEQTDAKKSIGYYEHVCDILLKEEMDIPPEIMNNMGALYLAQGEYDKARKLFDDALVRLNEEGEEVEPFRITLMWNLARAHELLCHTDIAESIYKDVLRREPRYIDSFMRLGCVARDRGQIYESSVWFKEGMSVNQGHADAWTLIGNLHMSKHEWQPAQKKFEQILKMPQFKDDAYCLVALGNIWLETLFSVHRNKDKDKVHQERALAMYTKALKVQPKNMWAANGIGCVMAVRGNIQESREIFSQVREATADFVDVWLNIAHVYMEQRQYVAAVQMYLNAMKKFNKENDPQLLIYLARAYYRAGKLIECREALEKATLENPDNLLIKFNHACVLQRHATQTMKDEKATYAIVDGAVKDLKTAERIFRYIVGLRDDARAAGISCTFTEQQAQACGDLLKQAQVYLARAKRQDEEDKALKAKQEQERAALRKRLEEEKHEKEESIRRQMEDLKNTRHLYIQMTKDILRLPEIREEEKKARSGGGGGGRGRKRAADGEEFVNDSSDMGDWEGGMVGGGERGERRKKEMGMEGKAVVDQGKSRKRRERQTMGSGSDGEREGGGERKRKKKKLSHNVDVKHEPAPKLSAKQQQKIKSRAYISEEESSGDNNEPIQATQLSQSGQDISYNAPDSSSDSALTDSDEEVEAKPVRRKKMAAPPTDSEDDDDKGSGGGSGGSDDEDKRRPIRQKKKTARAALADSSDNDSDDAPVGGGDDDDEEAPQSKRRMSSSEDESD